MTGPSTVTGTSTRIPPTSSARPARVQDKACWTLKRERLEAEAAARQQLETEMRNRAIQQERSRQEMDLQSAALRRLVTPDGQTQAATFWTRMRDNYRGAIRALARDVRTLTGASLDDVTVIERIRQIEEATRMVRDRYVMLLPGSQRVDAEYEPLAAAVFEAVPMLVQGAKAKRQERGYAARIAELEADRHDRYRDANLKAYRERIARAMEEATALWSTAQEKVAAIPAEGRRCRSACALA